MATLAETTSGSTGPIRDAGWLSDDRARAARNVLLVLLPLAALAWLALSRGGMDRSGAVIGTDYLSFWTAGRFALAGQAASAYDPALHDAAQHAAFAGAPYAAFFYPPAFLLALLPFAWLPYFASLAAWLGATGYGYWRAVKLWAPDWPGALPAFLAMPALLVNAGHGQNGFLTATLLGGGAALVTRRPWLAGLCFGALVIKPHLALLVPFALLLRKAWRPFVAAGIAAAALTALSALVFGLDAWRGFLAVSPLAQATLEQGLVSPAKMQSLFAGVRLLGGPLALAYAVQALGVLAALAGLALAARKRADTAAQGALLVAGTLIATPFLLDYDLTLAAIPMAWLFISARKSGFLPYEKIALAALFLLPLVGRGVATAAHIPIGPLLLLALFAVTLRRALGKPAFNPL